MTDSKVVRLQIMNVVHGDNASICLKKVERIASRPPSYSGTAFSARMNSRKRQSAAGPALGDVPYKAFPSGRYWKTIVPKLVDSAPRRAGYGHYLTQLMNQPGGMVGTWWIPRNIKLRNRHTDIKSSSDMDVMTAGVI